MKVVGQIKVEGSDREQKCQLKIELGEVYIKQEVDSDLDSMAIDELGELPQEPIDDVAQVKDEPLNAFKEEPRENILPLVKHEPVTIHKSNSKSHMCIRKHTAGDQFTCNDCGYRTNHKRNLVNHMRKHTGNMFTCSECNYCTTHTRYLKIHMRKHTSELLTCSECDYHTAYASNLKNHMHKHTGDLFSCSECDYRSARPVKLRKHVQKHTGDLLSCSECDSVQPTHVV